MTQQVTRWKRLTIPYRPMPSSRPIAQTGVLQIEQDIERRLKSRIDRIGMYTRLEQSQTDLEATIRRRLHRAVRW